MHPRLLPELTEECRAASANSQLMITTHSPFFVDNLKPEELWVLYRDENGFTQAKKTATPFTLKEYRMNERTAKDAKYAKEEKFIGNLLAGRE